jgi:hypothetical protein
MFFPVRIQEADLVNQRKIEKHGQFTGVVGSVAYGSY